MGDWVVDPDGTGDYLSLNAFNAAEAADITGGAGDKTVDCTSSSGSADTATCLVGGWTTDATHRLVISAAAGDEALKTAWDASRYRLSGTDADNFLYINDEYVTINALQIENNYSAAGARCDTVYIAGIGASNNIRFSNCRLKSNNNSSQTFRAFLMVDADVNFDMWNCIIENFYGVGIWVGNGTSINIYNSIIYNLGNEYGINVVAGTVNVYNCAVFSTPNDFNGTFNTNDHNASDDGDGTNAVAASGGDWANEYPNYATYDWTLDNGGNCYQGGADNPSSGIYTTDIEGDSYNSGAYSIGVDEYVAAGGNINKIISDNDINSQIFKGIIFN